MVGFGQSAFTVVAPVQEARIPDLRALLAKVEAKEPEVLVLEGVEGLHFCAFALIPVGKRTMLLFEGNIDGEPGPFLDRLAAERAAGVAEVFGFCEGFLPGQAAAYLKRHDKGIHTFYVGCPGRTLKQIREEQAIRESLEAQVEKDADPERLKSFARGLPGAGPYERPPFVRYGRTLYLTGLYGIFVVLALIFVALWLAASLKAALIYLVVLIAAAAGAILTLRHLEKTDEPWENLVYKPSVDECLEREDFGIGNHFTSVTEIKPGLFRQGALRYVLALVHWEGLLLENKGSLSNIPSIHFARWTILDGKWLLFLSNFDGSWESYLNDFIDKGHEGLTSVWSNTVGFPRTRLLRYEGATHEREFKVYARNSQSPTLVWYRAYDDLTTKNIENNTCIREGLHKTMTKEEDARWRRRL